MAVSIIENAFKEEAAKQLSEKEKQAFETLKLQANLFLKDINIIYAKKHQLKIEAIKNINISNIYKSMRSDNTYTQELLEKQHIFASQLDIFMERQTYLTYVTEEGELIFYGESATGELYKQATGNVGRGNISEGMIDKENNKAKELDSQLRKKIKKRENMLKGAYAKAIRRYEKNNPTGQMNYNPSSKTFYWRKDYATIVGQSNPINNRGRIAEAYANIILSSQQISSNEEENIEKINANLGSDNINAIVKADVVMDEIINGRQQQFAIKSGKFSTARLGSYIRFAQNINNLGNTILTKEHFLANDNFLLRKMSGTGKKVLNIFKDKATDEVNKLLQNFS